MGVSSRLILLISVPTMALCAALLYYLSRKDGEEEWEEVGPASGKMRVAEVRVPCDRVATVIGRGGRNIQGLQTQTGTRINFSDKACKDQNGEYRVCRIRGPVENVERAELLLRQTLTNTPEVVTTEMWVPQTACGRIIGRCGENIKAISRESNARIVVDSYQHQGSHSTKGGGAERQVIIKGSAQEVAIAETLIRQAVQDDIDFQKRKSRERGGPVYSASASKQDRAKSFPSNEDTKSLKPSVNGVESTNSAESTDQATEASDCVSGKVESLRSEASEAATVDGMIQVYVSTTADPHTFWVQLVSRRSVELDELVEEMTDYYSQSSNQRLHSLTSVKPGQVVAAPFQTDGRWYRVEVCGFVEGQTDEQGNPMLDIMYLDYGDSGYLPLAQVLELKPEFMKLKFQAIECKLANVAPVEAEGWSERCINEFEELVYSAQWKHLLLRLEGGGERSDTPAVPLVTLHDPHTGCDIGGELVKRGLATRQNATSDKAPESPTQV